MPWLEDGAAERAFLARPSLLICSEMLIGILSPPGVTSRELDEGSFLTVAGAGVFFVSFGFGVEVLGAGVVELPAASSAAAAAAFAFFSASI